MKVERILLSVSFRIFAEYEHSIIDLIGLFFLQLKNGINKILVRLRIVSSIVNSV